ncbi:hypothetical protein BLS_000019 [Venturia inaequalis]|uniref:Uncharacterized protein n=1 Tax=Venturia inaequalis TaxID=5025 RepID=A0A8H3VCM8_VENIN|nr:hypothetical protein BLS_000019 [Venturia inaequalis]
MRDTMRDGQKATRSASNRSKIPKEPLGRVGTTTSRPELTRAPSSMDATLAAGAAIDRHGTPMHSAITKPRESPAKPQPVRRPTRETNPPPSPIFEDIDLESAMPSGSMSSRSTDPSSLGSSARKKESFDSWSTTGPEKYSLGASDDGSRLRAETPGTEGQGSSPPQAKERGCLMNALNNFWEDWKEVRRVGGPSQEAMLWEDIKDWWSGGSKVTDVERSPRPAAAGPPVELDQFASGANRGFLAQAQRAVTPRVQPVAAAARRGGPERPRDSDAETEITTWTNVINASKGIGPKSGLRNEVHNDSPQNVDDSARAPAFRIRTKGEGHDDTVDNASFNDFDGHHGDDWDRQTRAPTMASSNYNARMSHANTSDWKTVDAPRPTSSIYTTTTNGHPNAQHYGRSDSPPSVPAIPGEYLQTQNQDHDQNVAPAPRNPWQEQGTRRPVSPMNGTYGSSNADEYTPVSPLQASRDEYVPARTHWDSQAQRDEQDAQHRYQERERIERRDTWERNDEAGEEEEGSPNTGTDFYSFYRENGPVFSREK